MADIELVIKVPKKLTCEGFERPFTEEEKNILIKAIANGTPLPKGHGDLIDRKELLRQPMDLANYPSNYVYIAPTIIEADKTESEVRDADSN